MRSSDIARLLVIRRRWPDGSYGAHFDLRKHLVVVRNVSYGLLPWEADLIVCTKAGYLTEVEIKVSFSDWKADLKKQKFVLTNDNVMARGWKLIKHFYYAVPEELVARRCDLDLPDFAGVLSVSKKGVVVVYPAIPRTGVRALTPDEQIQLCRLGSMRAWPRKDK
jgi:hypothetical protein